MPTVSCDGWCVLVNLPALYVTLQALPRQTAAFVGPLAGRPNRVMDVSWQRQRALWLAAGTQEKEPVRIEALDVARENFTLPSSESLGEGADGIGRAKALAKPNESRAAQLREAKAKERASKKKTTIPNPFEIPIKAGRAARRALEALGKIDEVSDTPLDDVCGLEKASGHAMALATHLVVPSQALCMPYIYGMSDQYSCSRT